MRRKIRSWDFRPRPTQAVVAQAVVAQEVLAQEVATTAHDRVAHALMHNIGDAQLVVVGSRGRGGLAGMTLGSVSQALLQHSGCGDGRVHGPPAAVTPELDPVGNSRPRDEESTRTPGQAADL